MFIFIGFCTEVTKQIYLTNKEKEIVLLLGQGFIYNKTLARKLNRSVKTIETHVSNILKKYDITNKEALIQLAINKVYK